MTHEKLEMIAKEYLENEISIKKLASKHHVNKTNLMDFLSGKKEIKLSLEMQQRIDERKKQRWRDSKSTKGNLGKVALSNEVLTAAAKAYVENDELALRDVAAFNGITVATLYNNFTQENLGYELYEQVKQKYNSNHKGSGKTGI